MTKPAILIRRLGSLHDEQLWRRRADQARRLAITLSAKDAAILEAYAMECEAEATRARTSPIAA